jgi:hypothetical protein
VATKKPAHSAKKAAKAAKTVPSGHDAKKGVKASKPTESARVSRSVLNALEPDRNAKGSTSSSAADAGGAMFDRTASINAGIAGLRKRLREPSKASAPRSRTVAAQDPDRLDAALKLLGERYRSLLK